MRIHKIIPALVLGVVTVVVGHFISLRIVEDSKEVVETKLESTEPLLMVNRVMDANEWNPFSKTAQIRALKEHEEIMQKAREAEARIDKHSRILIWMALGLVLVTILIYFRGDYLKPALAMSLAFSALLFLRIGVDAPGMEIQVYSEDLEFPVEVSGEYVYEDLKDKEINLIFKKIKLGQYIEFIKDKTVGFDQKFHGRIYYQYQSKSILQSIKLLFKADNAVVAWALLLFSVIFPLLKLLLNIWILLWPRSGQWKLFSTIVYYLGKWSMADVFVVAMFLTYLALQNMGQQGVTVESQAKIGFYFFLTYVVLSVVSGILTQLWVKGRMPSEVTDEQVQS